MRLLAVGMWIKSLGTVVFVLWSLCTDDCFYVINPFADDQKLSYCCRIVINGCQGYRIGLFDEIACGGYVD